MAENNTINCPYHEDHSHRLQTLEENYRDLDHRETESEKNIAVFIERMTMATEKTTEAIEKLSPLTEIVSDMRQELSNNTKAISQMQEQISAINNDDRISIRGILKKTWPIWVGVGIALLVVIRNFINNGTVKF